MKTNYLRVSILKICIHVVIMDTPMKCVNTGAVTTVDIEVVFNRTIRIIGKEEVV